MSILDDIKKKSFVSVSGDEIQPLVIMGGFSSGKSTACGTIGGKILYIHSLKESHGPSAASQKAPKGTTITAFCYDDVPTADEALSNLKTVLGDAGLAGSFTAVVIDGIQSLEFSIRESKEFDKRIRTEKGGKNNFAEVPQTIEMLNEIMVLVHKLSQKGVQVIFTCPVKVKSAANENGISEAIPEVMSTGVAEKIIGQIPHRLFVVKLPIEIEDEAGKTHHHVFQFSTEIKKVSKDFVTKQATNFVNCSPCLRGILTEDLPDFMPADLKTLLDFRKKIIKSRK